MSSNPSDPFVCIECRETFPDRAKAWNHTNPPIGKDTGKGVLRHSLKKHQVVQRTVRATS